MKSVEIKESVWKDVVDKFPISIRGNSFVRPSNRPSVAIIAILVRNIMEMHTICMWIDEFTINKIEWPIRGIYQRLPAHVPHHVIDNSNPNVMIYTSSTR